MTVLTSAVSKSAASTIVLLALGLAGWTGPAAAQQPSPTQVSAIRSACRGDFQAHCAGVQPGGSAALACLKKNVAGLSPACQKAVTAVGGAAAPESSGAATAAAPPPAAAPPATAPPATVPGPTAGPAAAPARPAVPPRVELALLRRACGQDFQANCAGVLPGGGQVIACLAANQAALSPRCRRELAMARQNL